MARYSPPGCDGLPLAMSHSRAPNIPFPAFTPFPIPLPARGFAGPFWYFWLLGLLAALPGRVPPAEATPGSGSAAIAPADTVEAGSAGTWTIDYTAGESFSRPAGGVVVVSIPAGWTDPDAGPLVVPGHVEAEAPAGDIDSLVVRGREVWLYAGGAPGPQVSAGDHLLIHYGSPPPGGRALVQTTAPGTASFQVASDPDSAAPVPLGAGSPELWVAPAEPAMVTWEPAAISLIAGEPAAVRLSCRDLFGNLTGPEKDQLLSLTASSPSLRVLAGGLPVSEVTLPADSTGVSLEVQETAVGSGVSLRAADGDGETPALAAGLASVTTIAGPAALLDVRGIQDPVGAGQAASVVVEAFDAYGNRATDYAGTVGFSTSDPGVLTQLPADYTFIPADQGMHLFGGEVRLTTSGDWMVGAEDRADTQISGEQVGITVLPGPADSLVVFGIDDPAVAASPSGVTVEARDEFGNRATGYQGTVGFSTDDPHPGTVVPGATAFAAADSGRHSFPGGVVLMTAGVRMVEAADVLDFTIGGSQTSIDVEPGTPVAAVLSPPGSVPITVGASMVIVLTVRDQAGNLVPDEFASVALIDAADGALAPDPGHPGGTEGSATVQSGRTDATGNLSVFYVAPEAAGRNDILDAWTASIDAGAVADVTLSSTAAGATRLVILPAGDIADTAFAQIPLLIQAEDSFGNLDPTAQSLVRVIATSSSARFSIDGGLNWSAGPADSLSLVSGTTADRLRVHDPVAGLFDVGALDPLGFLATAVHNDLAVRPAAPAGVIPLAVAPDTLTADGQSEAAVAGGPVADRYGNAVAGMPVTVEAPPGSVVAVDEHPAPGIQRRTDPAGRFDFSVRAAVFPAEALIRAASGPAPDQGTASGSAALTFMPRVTLAFAPGSLVPDGAVPGDTVAFAIDVENLGPAAATFGGATVLRFADPGGATYASALTTPVNVGAGQVATLLFAAARLEPSLDPGWYTPLLTLMGTDARGASIDTLIAAGENLFALEVASLIRVTAPARVSRSQTGVQVQVVIANLGEVPMPVTGVGLEFSEAAYVERDVSPSLPDLLPGNSQRTYTVTVDVDPAAVLGPVAIDARAEFEIGGRPRSVAGAASPTSWTVETAANLAYAAGSLGPRLVSAGQTHPAGVVIDNTGGASVVLQPALTRVVFGQPGNQFASQLAVPTVVPGNGSAALRFADVTVPSGTPPGSLPVEVAIGGTENGAPYGAVLTLDDSLQVFAPAVLAAVAGSVEPDSVSLGQLRSFSLDVVNSGGAEIALRQGTVLRLDGQVTVDLALAGAPRVIAAGSQATLVFGPGSVDPDLGAGILALTVDALLSEHGIEGAIALPVSDPVVAENAALLRWVASSLAPARVTRGTAATFELDLANDGEAAVWVLQGTVFAVTDGTDSLEVEYPGPDRVVAGGGGQVHLAFPSAVVPAALADQAYAPALQVASRENEVFRIATAAAPPGELEVDAPADLDYRPGSLAPDLAVVAETVTFRLVAENRGGAGARPYAATELNFSGFSAFLDSLRSPAEIGGGTADTLFFRATSLATVQAGSHSPVVAFRGEDRNGVPLSVDLDLAPDEVTVLTGAALRVRELASEAPRGARVNRNQAITLNLRVANPGEEAVAGATATAQGAGLAGPVSVPLPTIAGGDSTAVEVNAIATGTVGSALVRATLAGGAGVISGAAPAILAATDDTLTLVIQRPALLAPTLAITAPAGATDGVASGGSLLDLEVVVANTGDAPIDGGGAVELRVPSGYGILGASEQSFAAGVPLSFAVAVPPGAVPRDSLIALLVDIPLDLNSGAQAQVVTPRSARAIQTVTAARLQLAAAIVDPPEAVDGTALPNQTVTIEGLVTNTGTAAAPGTGVLAIELDPELTLAPGEPSQRPFSIGQPVTFRVVAADRAGPPHSLRLTIVSAPPDENTGAPAAVERPEAALGLATIARAAQVSGQPPATSEPGTLLRGGALRPVLVLTVANPGPPAPENVIVLTGIAPALVKLLDPGSGSGEVAAVDARQVLGRLELRRDHASGDLAAEWNGSGVPSLTLADTLVGLQSRTYVLALAATASAPAGSYRVVLGGPGTVTARDPGTGEAVPILLAQGPVESASFALYEGPHAAPNPFGPGRERARLAYVLEQDAGIAIEIFTLFGDLVWSHTVQAGGVGGRAGLNQVEWDGRNDHGDMVRNGVYHCRIRGGGLDAMVKIAAIR